jgi:hypothetical protein
VIWGVCRLQTPHYIFRGLRSASQPLQSREHQGATLATKPPLEFVDTEGLFMPFPLQHTKRHQAAGEVMQLRPLRARLTAGQAELILADANHFLLRVTMQAIPSIAEQLQCEVVLRGPPLRQRRRPSGIRPTPSVHTSRTSEKP